MRKWNREAAAAINSKESFGLLGLVLSIGTTAVCIVPSQGQHWLLTFDRRTKVYMGCVGPFHRDLISRTWRRALSHCWINPATTAPDQSDWFRYAPSIGDGVTNIILGLDRFIVPVAAGGGRITDSAKGSSYMNC